MYVSYCICNHFFLTLTCYRPMYTHCSRWCSAILQITSWRWEVFVFLLLSFTWCAQYKWEPKKKKKKDHLLSGTPMALKHWWSLSRHLFNFHPIPIHPIHGDRYTVLTGGHALCQCYRRYRTYLGQGWIVSGVGGGDVYQAEECCSVGFVSLREWLPNVIHISFRTGKSWFRSSTPLCPLQSLLVFFSSFCFDVISSYSVHVSNFRIP